MDASAALPLTLRPSRRRMVSLLLIAMLFVAAGAWIVFYHGMAGYTVDEIPIYWIGWASLVFFGLGAVIFLVQFIPGAAYLRLTPEGFTYCSAFRAHTTRWEDIAEFGIMHLQHNRLVGWNYAAQFKGNPRARGFSKKVTGYEAALPDNYGMTAEDLMEALDILRHKYAGARDAGA